MGTRSSFGPLLRKWRTSRSFSQERLAELAEISTRHLSFVETGKSSPSREMVLVLASALDLPLRDRNALLLAAGFAPAYRASSLDDPELRPVRRALDHLLRASEPYPAVVIDRVWNTLDMNEAARQTFAWVLGVPPPPSVPALNVFEALFAPGPVRDAIVNWHDVAGSLIERLHREVVLEPDDLERRRLLEAVLRHPGVPTTFREASVTTPLHPFIPVHLRKDGRDARFFTTLTTLGTPLDVTAQELRIETWFPGDDETEAFVRSLRC